MAQAPVTRPERFKVGLSEMGTALRGAALSRAALAVLWAVGLLPTGSCSGAWRASAREASSSLTQAQLIKRLEDIDYCSRMNANSFFASSVNSELSIYFADHADEVEKVLRQLRSGREVPPADINSALDTSYAKRIGGYPC